MSQKTAEQLKEELFKNAKNGRLTVGDKVLAECDEYCEGYKDFLNNAKTEREAVKTAIKTAKNAGRGKLIRLSLLSKDEFTPLNADSLQEDDYKKGYGVIEGNALLFSPVSAMSPTLLLNPNGEKLYYKKDEGANKAIVSDTKMSDNLVKVLPSPM